MVKTVTLSPDFAIHPSLPIGHANWDFPEYLSISQTRMHKLFKTLAIETGAVEVPLPVSEQAWPIPALEFTDPLNPQLRVSGELLLSQRLCNDGLLVLHRGKLVHESYRNGFSREQRHVIHSCSKSIVGMLCAIAIAAGRLDPAREVTAILPEFAGILCWQGVTVQHVLDMQAGVAFSEDYSDPAADYWSYTRAAGYYPASKDCPAIGIRQWMLANLDKREYPPGQAFVYNSCLSNVLAMLLQATAGRHFADILEQDFYCHLGAEKAAWLNTDSLGFPIVEGQLNLSLQDFARVAWVAANHGKSLSGQQLVPASFFSELVTPSRSHQQAYQRVDRDTLHPDGQYRNQFWVLEPAQQRFAMLGIHGQFAWVDQQQQLLIVGLGSYPQQDSDLLQVTLEILWQGIAKHMLAQE